MRKNFLNSTIMFFVDSRMIFNLAIYYQLSVLGRVSGSGAENFRRFTNPRKNTVGSEGEVPNEGRIWSRVETEAEKKG